jgi:hypothetical protein|tara:strand:- start:900 stop:1073 length:174 start_codon:yes stop_codon:yes gene_type:complete
MGQNKKLLENIRQHELSKESLISMYEREMYQLAQPNQKEQIKTIINQLKPKQNGKRN